MRINGAPREGLGAVQETVGRNRRGETGEKKKGELSYNTAHPEEKDKSSLPKKKVNCCKSGGDPQNRPQPQPGQKNGNKITKYPKKLTRTS